MAQSISIPLTKPKGDDDEIHIASWNMNGGLVRDYASKHPKAEGIKDWINASEGIVLLQHTGVPGSEVPYEVKQTFKGMMIRLAGSEDQLQASVAVIAHEKWEALSKMDDNTGRVLGVELRAGEFIMRVVSIYMPAALESSSLAPTNPTRALANELAAKAICWAKEAEYFVIGGDWNEVCRREDRIAGGIRKNQSGVAREYLRPNTVNTLLTNNSRLVDVHRYVKGSGEGFTRHGAAHGGASRIDMLFASRELTTVGYEWDCHTVSGGESDHEMLVASFRLPFDVAEREELLGEAPREKDWIPSVTKMTASQLNSFRTTVIGRCSKELKQAGHLAWD